MPVSRPAAAALPPVQREAPVFRAGTRLVEVTLTARDSKGQAVPDLTITDFTVEDRGKNRPLAFLRFDSAPETAERRPPTGVYTNRGEASGQASLNVTALLLDTINTTPVDNMLARAQMMRYLKALAPETRVGLFLMGGELRVLHDFTHDPAVLRAQLEKVAFAAPLRHVSDMEQSAAEAGLLDEILVGLEEAAGAAQAVEAKKLEADMRANALARRGRMEASLAALESLGGRLSGIPGRKNLVWITAGFSMISMGVVGRPRLGGFDAYEGVVQRTAQRLAQQGIVLYIVQAAGLKGPAFSGARSQRPSRTPTNVLLNAEGASNDPHSAMELMASVTGGRYLHDTNDLAVGFKQTVADLRGSYTLGFYATEEADGRWHKLKVQVKRSGLTLRHRQGYLAEAAPPRQPEWNDEMWRQALTSPVGSSLIRLSATRASTPAGELVLRVSADPAGLEFWPEGDRFRAVLRIAVAEEIDGGYAPPHISEVNVSIPAAAWEAERTRDVPFRRQWITTPGATGLRVVAVDLRTGRYGRLDVPLGKP